MQEATKWYELSKTSDANYTGETYYQNKAWCDKFKVEGEFKKSMLEILIDLECALKCIKPEQLSDEIKKSKEESLKEKQIFEFSIKQNEEQEKKRMQDRLDEIDVKDDEEEVIGKTMNVEDDQVKDRWSRYIGAMGIEAVAKQSNATIFIDNLSPLAMEICKNLVLAGCKELIINDTQIAQWEDLSGNFFLSEESVKNKTNRAEACLKKL